MNALAPPVPPFPTNPTVGQVFLNWVWSGSAWICRGAGPVNVIKVFTASGTYWPSPGLTWAIVECIGGGGSGGGADSAAGVEYLVSGGGGGSGGWSRSSLAAALLANGVQVTVGAGGVWSGGPDTGNYDGGATSFGQFCIANGGMHGQGNDGGITGGGGGGIRAVRGTGDLTFPGASGGNGAYTYMVSPLPAVVNGGVGGTLFGGNLVSGSPPGSGGPGNPSDPNTGAGGEGAVVNQMAGPQLFFGGAGGSGVCIVTEWCFGNTSLVQDCGCTPCPPPSDPCQPQPCPPGGWWNPSW